MKLNLSPLQFENIIAQYLLDMLLNPEHVRNPDFTEIIDFLDKTGVKPRLLNYFLNLPARERVNFKRIKNILNNPESQDTAILNISNAREFYEDIEDADFFKLLYLTEEALKMSNSKKIRENKKYLTEKELKIIVKKLLNEYKKGEKE